MLFRSPVVRFFSRILNRVTITVVLVALQLLWLCWVAFAITTGTGRVWVNGLLNALSLLIVLYLVRKDENSAYKVGWIALIGILPLLGGALYLAFGNKRPAKRLRLKMQAVEDAHKKDLVQEPGVLEGLDAREQGQSRYVAKYGPYPAWQNTRTQYFACGEAMYPQLLADLEKAEKSIFLEYFIVSHGCMWNGIEKILRRKAAQGVDVRLIYDDFGSLLGLPADFIVRMERAHIRCIPFNPVVPLVTPVSDGIVQPYADSPLDEEPMAETVYLNILAQAQRYVYIYTPYLAVGEEMLDALKNAAKRGVDIRLVLPGIPDKKLVFRLSRSYYLPLLRAGVRIYEYTPGFLHAKCWVSDDVTAVVGSINMDYRSLFLHFECGVLLQKNSQVAVLRDDVRATLPQCREIQVMECRTSLPGTVLDSVLRLLSPLM